MRRIAISVLSVFIAAPVFGAHLPVVNVAAGSVSARAAFGEAVASPAQVSEPRVAKKVVARPAVKKTVVDSGENIVATADVLSPRRPSGDLWARSGDAPLRMPSPSEFSVIRSDSLLPEENIDSALAHAPVRETVPVREGATASEPMADIDAQIARLVELQRRADDSIRESAPVSVASVQPRDVTPRVIARPVADEPASVSENIAMAEPVAEPVSLKRMVVPMESENTDVVVRSVEKNTSPRIAAVRGDMTKMSPEQLRRAFRKTFLSENKHLSTFAIDNRFDTVSDMSTGIEGFTAKHDLSEGSGIRPLEIKIKFRNDDSALSRENYNLLTEYASIVVNKPTRAIQVAIPQSMTMKADERKLAARRLAIVEQVLRDNGVAQQRIVPVLSQRNEQGFVLRIISSDQYETLTQQQHNMFGDTVGTKSYKSMSW